MKYAGAVVILLGIWLTVVAWNDPVEGKVARPAGVVMGVAGLFVMLEGFKREILRGLNDQDRGGRDGQP